MLKIERWGNGFKVAYMGEHWFVLAQDFDELVSAIAHYFGSQFYGKWHDDTICPTCKKVLARIQKYNRQQEQKEKKEAEGR